jgi:hypothetical protein
MSLTVDSGDTLKVDQERMARTEALFRDVNERIAESAERFDAERADFVCECGDQRCTDRVPATLDEYERARMDGTHFIIRPGHENRRYERVVERDGKRLAIVEKFQARVAAIARKLDPRVEPA